MSDEGLHILSGERQQQLMKEIARVEETKATLLHTNQQLEEQVWKEWRLLLVIISEQVAVLLYCLLIFHRKTIYFVPKPQKFVYMQCYAWNCAVQTFPDFC